MLEISTTRHNPLVDPVLSVWSWEIPVYLFFGGMIAGMMILAGINMLKLLKGERPESFYSVQTPILGLGIEKIDLKALWVINIVLDNFWLVKALATLSIGICLVTRLILRASFKSIITESLKPVLSQKYSVWPL